MGRNSTAFQPFTNRPKSDSSRAKFDKTAALQLIFWRKGEIILDAEDYARERRLN